VPIQTRREPRTPPPVYAWLAGQPDGVVLELPLPVPDDLWGYERHYQLMSIYHWKPLVNGYSGHAPADYVRFLDTMRDFPSDRSLDAIRARDVRWLIVHEGLIARADRPRFMEAVVRQSWLRPVGTYADAWGSASIFELHPDKSVSRRPNPSQQ
jgi:hypothetical protein